MDVSTAVETTGRAEAERLFRRLFQASPAPFLVLAPDAPRFTIKEVNDAYLAATMTTREGIVGRGVFEAFPDNPDDPTITGVSTLRSSLERVLATHEPNELPGLKYDIARPDGSFEERWWSPINSPVLNERGQVEAIIHNANDVTEDRRKDAALRESEERYRQIVEGADDFAIVTIDAHGVITSWNTGAERLLGFSEADALGRHGYVFFTPEDREAGAPEHEMARAHSEGRAVNERWHVRKDGSRFWGSGLMMRIDEDGGGFLKIFGDRTAEHEAEAALRQSESRLAFLDRLVAETTPLADADAVLATTTRLLGEHLNLAVCAYADMDGDQDGFTIRGDWAAPGSTSIVGHYQLADFGTLAVEKLSAGEPLVINDNLREIAPEEAATFQAIGIAATICMPLVKQGRLTALMAIHDRVPRKWNEAELSLLREVTARSWAHVERVAAVAELRDSEGRFRLMADAVPQIVWITDAGGRVEFFNKQWFDYIGSRDVPVSASDVAARYVHPDDEAHTIAAFNEARRTGTTYMVEHRIRSAAGGYRWFLVRGEPYRDPRTGDVVRWFGTSVDIHARKLAEEALATRNRRLDLLARIAGGLMLDKPPEERLETAFADIAREVGADYYFNFLIDDTEPNLMRLAFSGGLDDSERAAFAEIAVGEYLCGRVAATCRPVVIDDLDKSDDPACVGVIALEGKCYAGFPLIAGGRLIGTLSFASTVCNGFTDDQVVLMNTVTDQVAVTLDRSRAMAALRESEARLRAVVDAAPVGLVFADASGRITGANARVEEIIGTPIARSDAIDNYGSDYVAFHADGRRVEADEYPLARILRGEGDRAELEVQVQLPDGSLRWVRYIATPMKDEEGRMIGAVVASLNIDQEKSFAENLAREVERAMAELETAQQALRQSQKMEAMGQLTGGVAHDFNNLLTPIIGSLDMLQRRGSATDRERRLIDGALQSAEKAKTLVQRLLAFARRQPLQAQAVDVPRLVGDMAELVASTSGPHIKVKVDAEQDLPFAHADPNQLEMAILNLAVNARDAMPDGGSLTISARLDEVGDGHRSGLPSGRYVRLSVSDTGVGMDEAVLARAVEPFFSTKGIGRGTGLGLSMVEGLAAQLGGALAIDSRPSVGTAIHLWLPVTDADAIRDEEAVHVERLSSVGTALLVDDEELVRASTAEMLADIGYAVVEAASGEEALRLIDSGLKFDLLLTDHLMPGIKGTELAGTLRQRFPQCPALVISGYAEFDGIAPDLPRLSKPFRQSELAAALAELRSSAEVPNPQDPG